MVSKVEKEYVKIDEWRECSCPICFGPLDSDSTPCNSCWNEIVKSRLEYEDKYSR